MDKKRRMSAVLLGALMMAVLPASPVRADGLFNGVCTLSVTLTFSVAVSQNSGPRDAERIDATGTCVNDGNIIGTILIFAEAEGDVTQCSLLEMNGTWVAGFSPQPGPPSADGTLGLIGNMAAIEMDLSGVSPMFTGVFTGVNSSSACMAGTKTFTYAGTFAFSDP